MFEVFLYLTGAMTMATAFLALSKISDWENGTGTWQPNKTAITLSVVFWPIVIVIVWVYACAVTLYGRLKK